LFKIVAAVDKSDYASVVMKTVSRLSSFVESEVTILSAVKPKHYRAPESGGEDINTMKEFHQDLIRKYFPQNSVAVEAKYDRAADLFPARGATVHSKVVEGDPADAIRKYAEKTNADVVVVGKRGGRDVGALLLGSVSEKVVHECTCSVLVAKAGRVNDESWMNAFHALPGHSRSISHQS
jgi:nucleotide-binding universal stress UspA family protein